MLVRNCDMWLSLVSINCSAGAQATTSPDDALRLRGELASVLGRMQSVGEVGRGAVGWGHTGGTDEKGAELPSLSAAAYSLPSSQLRHSPGRSGARSADHWARPRLRGCPASGRSLVQQKAEKARASSRKRQSRSLYPRPQIFPMLVVGGFVGQTRPGFPK